MIDYESMTNEDLIKLAKNHKDVEAREIVFKKIQPFLWFLVKKWNNNWLDNEELFSMFYEWSYIAYKKYDPNVDVKFITYISSVIRNKMFHVYRNNKAEKRSKYDTPTSLNELNHDTLGLTDVFTGHKNINTDFELIIIAKEIINKIYKLANERQKIIFKEHFINCRMLSEIGREFGWAKRSVERDKAMLNDIMFYIVNHMKLDKETCF